MAWRRGDMKEGQRRVGQEERREPTYSGASYSMTSRSTFLGAKRDHSAPSVIAGTRM